MTERLLQYIWQFQYFNRHDLSVADGAALQVLHPGMYNTNQGPDFLQAAVKIDNTILVGNIELHINTSHWAKHGHQADANYRNVVLHVVWHHDGGWQPPGIPLLELQNRVSVWLLKQYDEWMQQSVFIPCAGMVNQVNSLQWTAWKERLLAERLQRKTNYVLSLLDRNKQHWEETCWQLLARNFGMPINADAFENIARSLPITLLAKHKHQVTVLEALLLGQAGLLSSTLNGQYEKLLQREYRFHQHKYGLAAPAIAVHFLRMRPASFPTVRLAQLAMLIHQSVHFFTAIKEASSLQQIRQLLAVTANDYWHYHYRLDGPSEYAIKKLGVSMIDSIIVNTIAPLLFAYGQYHAEQSCKDKALQWLQEAAPEKNTLVKGWKQLGVDARNAAETQALLECKTQYCDAKRCLDCAVGNTLLKAATMSTETNT
jgi:Protein of unknown function (DUF2851)